MQKTIEYIKLEAMSKIADFESYSAELELLEEIYLFSMHTEASNAIDELKDFEKYMEKTYGYALRMLDDSVKTFVAETGLVTKFLRFVARFWILI